MVAIKLDCLQVEDLFVFLDETGLCVFRYIGGQRYENWVPVKSTARYEYKGTISYADEIYDTVFVVPSSIYTMNSRKTSCVFKASIIEFFINSNSTIDSTVVTYLKAIDTFPVDKKGPCNPVVMVPSASSSSGFISTSQQSSSTDPNSSRKQLASSKSMSHRWVLDADITTSAGSCGGIELLKTNTGAGAGVAPRGSTTSRVESAVASSGSNTSRVYVEPEVATTQIDSSRSRGVGVINLRPSAMVQNSFIVYQTVKENGPRCCLGKVG